MKMREFKGEYPEFQGEDAEWRLLMDGLQQAKRMDQGFLRQALLEQMKDRFPQIWEKVYNTREEEGPLIDDWRLQEYLKEISKTPPADDAPDGDDEDEDDQWWRR